jgi:streptogramin lyase
MGSLIVTARIHLPPGMASVATGYGGVWVSGARSLSEIDPSTDRVLKVIPAPGAEDYSHVAIGEGSVWVTADGGNVLRVDASRVRVVSTIHTGLYPEALAVGGGRVWVASPGAGPGTLFEIDPATDGVVRKIPIGVSPISVLFAAGSVWVSHNENSSGLLRIDPDSGATTKVSSLPGLGALAYGDGAIWTTSAAETDSVVRVDPATNRVAAVIPVPLAGAVAYGDSAVWVLTLPPSQSPTVFLPSRKHPGTVLRIDPETNRIFGKPVDVQGLQPLGVAFAAGSAWVIDYNGGTLSRVGVVPTASLGSIAFSRGGPNGGIYVMSPDGAGVTRLTFRSGDTAPAWSPDGFQIAFGDEDIYVMHAEGSGIRRLTSDGASSHPTWSPDGTRIAFAREALGNADIYIMAADGSDVMRLTDDLLREYTPAWSPDGTKIAFVGYFQGASGPPSPLRLYVMNADGTGPRQLGPKDAGQPSWSPDGTKIAFVKADTGSIYAINADGTGLRQVVDLAGLTGGRGNLTTSPTWSPDGTKLAFATGSEASSSHIDVVNADGSGLRQLTESTVYAFYPAWSPAASSSPQPSPAPTAGASTSPTTARVADTIDVGRATSVAYGAGAVWVSIDPTNSSNRAILRIDPQTDRVLATIPTPVVPGWEIGGGGLTVGDGSVWVAGLDASSNGTHGAIVRIDPSTNQVASTITLGGGKVADVAVDGGAIWALISGNPGRPEVVRIDPSSHAVVATIPLSGGYGRSTFATGGSVLVTIAQPPGGPFDEGTLVRIDAFTNEVSGTFDLGTYPSVAMGHGGIWAMTDGGLVQIDLATDQPTGAPAAVPCTGDALAVGAGGVWCFGAAADRALMRFNPETARVDVAMKPEEGTGGTALATSPGSVWVANGTQLVRVDLDEAGHASPTLPLAPGWYTQDGGVVPKGTIPVVALASPG